MTNPTPIVTPIQGQYANGITRYPRYNESVGKRTLRIQIPADLHQLMQHYIALADGEVSGLGSVIYDGENTFTVEALYLIEQVCTKASTRLTQEGIFALMSELYTLDRDSTNLRFWWHSHHTMEPFWSGEDLKTISEYQLAGAPWLISHVQNVYGESMTRLDMYDPLRLALHDVQVVILPGDPMFDEGLALATAEIDAKVSYEAPVAVTVVNYQTIVQNGQTFRLIPLQTDETYLEETQ